MTFENGSFTGSGCLVEPFGVFRCQDEHQFEFVTSKTSASW